MADIKAQLKAKNGDNLYPVTSLAYVSAVSSGGIVISGNSIYTSAIPQANVYRLTTSLGAKQAKCSAGFRTYVSGATIGQNRYFDIAAPFSSGTLTVSAGSAYRIFATGNTVTVNAEGSASSAGLFGLEGHAAILLTNSSYLKFGTNVVLGTPLQTDAINNCTLRFHDGHCIIDVEDHEAAHAVTVATDTGTGSLYYWANWANTTSASATPAYVSFSDALDGTACSFNGVTVNGDKHFVGNGKTLTIVTGNATASSKTYLTNMAISGATITGGTVYATDVLIPAGATTVVSSPLYASNTLEINGTLKTKIYPTNGLSITGGGVILADGRVTLNISNGQVVTVNGVTFTGPASYNGIIQNYGTTTLTNCLISGCTGTAGYITAGGSLTLSNCILTSGSWNTGTGYKGIVVADGGTLYVYDTTFTDGLSLYNGNAYFYGTVKFPANNMPSNKISSGILTLTSSSILDLTGNTNATPINPGGGITFEAGGATVITSDGRSCFADNLSLPVGASIKNNGVIDFGGMKRQTTSSSTINIDGFTFTNAASSGDGGYGYYFYFVKCNTTISNCSFPSLNVWNAFVRAVQGTVNVKDSQIISLIFDTNTSAYILRSNISLLTCNSGASCTIDGTHSTVRTVANATGVITIASGTTITFTGTAPRYVSAATTGNIKVPGGCKVVYSGNTYSIAAGNYKSITDSGTTTT